MTEAQFRQKLRDHAYGEPEVKNYVPNRDGPLHTHAFSVMLLILDGEFTLGFEDGSKSYRPGEVCELPANERHTERTGPNGARVLLARRTPPESGAAP